MKLFRRTYAWILVLLLIFPMTVGAEEADYPQKEETTQVPEETAPVDEPQILEEAGPAGQQEGTAQEKAPDAEVSGETQDSGEAPEEGTPVEAPAEDTAAEETPADTPSGEMSADKPMAMAMTTLQVTFGNPGKKVITAFSVPTQSLSVEKGSLADVLKLLPNTVTVTTSDGSQTEIQAVWSSADDYENTQYELYTFVLELPEGYVLADGMTDWDIPYVDVSIIGAANEDARTLYNANPNGAVTIDQAFGIPAKAIVTWLESHEKDSYYLGTPYLQEPYALYFAESICANPNGEHGGRGMMNCTGFVASVFKHCGANLSGLASWVSQNTGYNGKGGYINASNWYRYVMYSKQAHDIRSYAFASISDALNSGMLHKGDIIYFEPLSWGNQYDRYGNAVDCHMGFFWGNTSSENRFWHSSIPAKGVEGASSMTKGNQISEISPACADCRVYVWPLSTQAAAPAEQLIAYKTTDNLNYRKGPGTSYGRVGTLKKGTTVQVVSGYTKKANGYTWFKIKKDKGYYYVASAYLKKVSVTPPSTGSASPSVPSGSTGGSSAPSGSTGGSSAPSGSSGGSSGSASSSGTSGGETYSTYKTTDRLNYRTGPGTSYSRKGTLAYGASVQVVNGYTKKANGYTWYKIKMGGSYYYVASNYLKKTASASTSGSTGGSSGSASSSGTSGGETYTTYKTTDRLNYRTGPGTSYTRKGTLSYGASVQVVNGYAKKANGYTWYKIKKNGSYYYVASAYLKR